MGDAQFYKGDFYAAIEVYEYVAGTYKGKIPGAQAEINLVITYLQLKRYDDAEALYNKLNRLWPVSSRQRSLASSQSASSPGLYGAGRQL